MTLNDKKGKLKSIIVDVSATPEDHYRQIYFEAIDLTVIGLATRFEPAETTKHYSAIEEFLVGKCDVSYVEEMISKILLD